MWLSNAAWTTSTSFLPSKYAQIVLGFFFLIATSPIFFLSLSSLAFSMWQYLLVSAMHSALVQPKATEFP